MIDPSHAPREKGKIGEGFRKSLKMQGLDGKEEEAGGTPL